MIRTSDINKRVGEKTEGMRGRKSGLFQVCVVVFLIFHLFYACFWGSQKINYHVDEYYTYGLANNRGSIDPVIEDGVPYQGDSVFLNYLSPDDSERFDYSIVWENQANDVHPPLYYILIHTVCSFFPGIFSKWEALSVNLVLLIIVDGLVFLTARQIFRDRWTAFLTMVINGMTLLCVNTILFLRMYMLMTVFVLGVTALFLKYFKRNKDKKFYLLLFFLSLGGALTQYYFLIYLFFLCLVFGIGLIVQREWKDIVYFLLALGCAGGASIAIFPAMINQIFGDGYRGKEAFGNARTLADVPAHISEYIRIINDEVFGGLGVIVLLFAVCFLLLLFREQQKNRSHIFKLCLFVVPTVCYCVMIAVIAPYQYDRYVMAVGPLLVLAGIWPVYYVMDSIFSKQKKYGNTVVNGISVGIFAVMICSAMRLSGWTPEYTYRNTEARLETAKEYADCHALYMYVASWTVNDNMQELLNYQDYTFLKENELADYTGADEDEELVLYVPKSIDIQNVITSIQTKNPKLTNVELLYENKHQDFANVYHLGK